MKGLIIKSPWIDLILDNKKIWEIRSSNTNIRGKIGLIKSGTKKIFGTAELIDCIEIATESITNYFNYHQIPKDKYKEINYKKTYAWVFSNPKRLNVPIDYNHKQGCIIWVNIPDLSL